MEKLTLVATYQLKEIAGGSGPSFRFRVEIFKDEALEIFSVSIYRLEFLRIQPSFPQKKGKPTLVADEEIWIIDRVLLPDDYSAKSEQECLEAIDRQLKEFFV